jgi:hypothetical protein
MNTVFYSNHCPFSQQILSILVKSQLSLTLNFICTDKRKDNRVLLENGQMIVIPPEITQTPSYVSPDGFIFEGLPQILKYFQPQLILQVKKATGNEMEPQGFSLGR